MTNPTPTPPMPEPAAPAAGSSERAAWDRLDVVAKRIHAAWLRDHPPSGRGPRRAPAAGSDPRGVGLWRPGRRRPVIEDLRPAAGTAERAAWGGPRR